MSRETPVILGCQRIPDRRHIADNIFDPSNKKQLITIFMLKNAMSKASPDIISNQSQYIRKAVNDIFKPYQIQYVLFKFVRVGVSRSRFFSPRHVKNA